MVKSQRPYGSMMSFASSSLLVVVGLRPSVLRDGVMGSFLESLAQDSFPGHLNHLGQSLHRGNLGLNHRRIVQGGNGTANRRDAFFHQLVLTTVMLSEKSA